MLPAFIPTYTVLRSSDGKSSANPGSQTYSEPFTSPRRSGNADRSGAAWASIQKETKLRLVSGVEIRNGLAPPSLTLRTEAHDAPLYVFRLSRVKEIFHRSCSPSLGG